MIISIFDRSKYWCWLNDQEGCSNYVGYLKMPNFSITKASDSLSTTCSIHPFFTYASFKYLASLSERLGLNAGLYVGFFNLSMSREVDDQFPSIQDSSRLYYSVGPHYFLSQHCLFDLTYEGLTASAARHNDVRPAATHWVTAGLAYIF